MLWVLGVFEEVGGIGHKHGKHLEFIEFVKIGLEEYWGEYRGVY
jgi:hypothetical protein